jgi:putative PIN family toxin of toxin-antitoxin system
VRVVLDTNILVSGIFWGGIPNKILESWVSEKFELLLSEDILKEYERVLFKISKGKKDQLVNHWLLFIAENSLIVNVKKRFKLSIDPDDDKFIECAVAGNAKYIVSGDSHLLDLKNVMNIEILLASDFVNIL